MINETISIADKTYKLGVGGLHSEDLPGVFQTTNSHKLILTDVASFYPALILNEKFKPEHLTERFFEVYDTIRQTRLAAKAKGDKVTDQTLKITLNSTFGLSNFFYYWLYDPAMFFSITLSGQLLLLDLIEKLTLQNIEVISANTDSVFCQVKPDQEKIYYSVCEEWQQRNDLVLEFEEAKKYIRRDVNSYMIVYESGNVKTKGIFVDNLLPSSKAKKRVFITSYNAPIIALGLQNYFKDNIDPEQTVNEESDIFNFMFSQSQDRKFKLVAEKIESGILKRETLQKTNRWIVSKNGYRLKKLHQRGGRDSALMKDCNVMIANNVSDVFLEDIDKQYYINEVYKIIHDIEGTKNGQMSLF